MTEQRFNNPLLKRWKSLLCRQQMPTQIRTEAAKARLKLGEARLETFNQDDVFIQVIEDKDGVVVLDYDY